MQKQNQIILKKIKTIKNKRISNKSVILGNNKLLGRYYNAGASYIASFKGPKLAKVLQYHYLNVSTKVGWLLIKGLVRVKKHKKYGLFNNYYNQRLGSMLESLKSKGIRKVLILGKSEKKKLESKMFRRIRNRYTYNIRVC